MAQLLGTSASVTNGSAIITDASATFVTNGVTSNDSFVASTVLGGDGVLYDIASVDSETQITLASVYGGTTATGVSYAIQRDFTTDGIPELSKGDIETSSIFTRAVRKIQTLFNGIVNGTTALSSVNITGGSIIVPDGNLSITGSLDATKIAKLEVDGLTTGTTRTYTLQDSSDTLVGRATTDTLTNKSVDLASNTVTGTTLEFNTALSDNDFATLAGTETLTNKTVSGGSITGTTNLDVAANSSGNTSRWVMGTASSTATYWSKLKTWTVSTSATSQISETIHFEATGVTSGSTSDISLHAECDATGTISTANSNIQVSGITGSLFTYNGFQLVQPAAGTLELWVQAQASGAVVGVYEISAEQDAGVLSSTYHDGSTWSASVSAGTAVTSDWAGFITFVPVAIGATTAGTGTYLEQGGSGIVRNGEFSFNISLAWTAHTGTGNLIITGIPFTNRVGDRVSVIIGRRVGLAGSTDTTMCAYIEGSASTITFELADNVTGGAISVPVDPAVTQLTLHGTMLI